MTAFFRVLDAPVDEKSEALLHAVEAFRSSGTRFESSQARIFERAIEVFATVPGSPLAYWLSDSIRAVFKSLAKFGDEGRKAVLGLKTSDDSRFVRLHWEVAPSPATERRWVCFRRPEFDPFAADV